MNEPPSISFSAALASLPELLGPRNLLGALAIMRNRMGNIFRLNLPGYAPFVASGPDALHKVLVEAREAFHWRLEDDPVTGLLRHGVLVEDGAMHEELRRALQPSVHRGRVEACEGIMQKYAEQVLTSWKEGVAINMLAEMRKVALLIFMESFFAVDFSKEYDRLLPDVFRMLHHISPGAWLFLPMKRKAAGVGAALEAYLRELIRNRRAQPTRTGDMLSQLIESGMEDELIRDQMLTMLIAGHDTNTALLAWTLHALGENPDVLRRLQEEIDSFSEGEVFERRAEMTYLAQVIQETLRMYPPIFGGNRIAAEDVEVGGYRIPRGSRVMLSYFATHYAPEHWPDPYRFDPDRFAPGKKYAPYTYLPFGGGPRGCLGSHFAQVEAQIALIAILKRFHLQHTGPTVRFRMSATLEPTPGVWMIVNRRRHP